MTSQNFTFVQGNERLDWGVLVSIDVDRLMKDTNVDTLQRVVENLAFARVTRDEAAMFTPEHVLHIFTLCQVVLQYLVFSQECLAKMNLALHERLTEAQGRQRAEEERRAQLESENRILKKDVKAQRRTLMAYEYNTQNGGGGGIQGRGATGNVSPAAHVCPACGESYHKYDSLRSHMRKRHFRVENGEETSPNAVGTVAAGRSHSPYISGVDGSTQQWVHDQQLAALREAQSTEIKRMQDKMDAMEQRLAREQESTQREQRDQLMMLLLGRGTGAPALSPVPETETRHVFALPGQPPPAATPTAHTARLPLENPESISSVPIIPDLAAMAEYNMTRQRETANNALVRQIQDLQKEIRDLKRQPQPSHPPEPTPPTESSAPSIPTVIPADHATSTASMVQPSWLTPPAHTAVPPPPLPGQHDMQSSLVPSQSTGVSYPPYVSPPACLTIPTQTAAPLPDKGSGYSFTAPIPTPLSTTASLSERLPSSSTSLPGAVSSLMGNPYPSLTPHPTIPSTTIPAPCVGVRSEDVPSPSVLLPQTTGVPSSHGVATISESVQNITNKRDCYQYTPSNSWSSSETNPPGRTEMVWSPTHLDETQPPSEIVSGAVPPSPGHSPSATPMPVPSPSYYTGPSATSGGSAPISVPSPGHSPSATPMPVPPPSYYTGPSATSGGSAPISVPSPGHSPSATPMPVPSPSYYTGPSATSGGSAPISVPSPGHSPSATPMPVPSPSYYTGPSATSGGSAPISVPSPGHSPSATPMPVPSPSYYTGPSAIESHQQHSPISTPSPVASPYANMSYMLGGSTQQTITTGSLHSPSGPLAVEVPQNSAALSSPHTVKTSRPQWASSSSQDSSSY